MSSLLNFKNNEKKIQDAIKSKLDRGDILTDEDLRAYALTDEDVELMDMLASLADGKAVAGFDLKDFLASPQAKILIPKVLIGKAREAADPVYLASKFFNKIRLKNGQAVMFPEFGVMRAYDVAEGQEIDLGVSVA